MQQINTYLGPCAPQADPLAISLTLTFDQRSKSRARVSLSNGNEAALILPRGTVLRGGDCVQTTTGQRIAIIAAPEAVLYATAAQPLTVLKAAYHLGNRHTPVELGYEQGQYFVAITFDPVLADMLSQLGLTVQPAMRPFEPEHGAYGGGHKHGHDDTFEQDYALAQSAFAHHHGDGHLHSHD